MGDIFADKWLFLVAAWSAFFVAAITPGPNMLAVMERAFGGGRNAAIGVAIGIASGSFLWSITTTSGMVLVATQIPFLVPVIGLLGGLYLLNLGVSRLRSIASPSGTPNIIPTKNTQFAKDVAHGFMVIVSNPKVALFWVSLSAIIAKSALSYYQAFLFSMTCALTALAIYACEALIFSQSKIRSVYFNRYRVIDMAFSLLFVLIGLLLIWAVFEELLSIII